MKKLFFFLLLSGISISYCFSNIIAVSTAKTAGYHYLLQKGATLNSADDLSLVYTSSGGTTVYFYIFSSADCFVLVTADDGVIPVLGYSIERPFHGDHIPNTVTGFFDDYNKQIAYIITNKIEGDADIAAQWENLIKEGSSRSAARTTSVIVGPLLTTT